LKLRVDELERRLAGAGGTGVAVSEPAPGASGDADPEIVRLLREGKDVQATALVHKQEGGNLAEAKAQVDRIKAQLSL
jgi:hypothetical protein